MDWPTSHQIDFAVATGGLALRTGTGGGIAATHGTPETMRPAAIVTLTRTALSGNTAISVGGGIAMFGDEIYGTRPTLLLHQSIVVGNDALGGGGGLYLNRTSAGVSSSMIMNNLAETTSSWGGGIWLTNRSAMTMVDTTVADNFARAGGGGMVADDWANFDISQSRFYANRTEGPTGAVAC